MPSTVIISARGDERIRRGHPWVYRADVIDVDAEGGEIVQVIGPRRRTVGYALFSDRSQIPIRMLTRGEVVADEPLIRARLERAIAFRAALADAPPERNAERARQLVEARDLLLDPRQVLVRTLGDLRVPRAEHFVPGHERRPAPEAPRETAPAPSWSARSRLVAIMTLYALLEDELEGGGAGAQTGSLF